MTLYNIIRWGRPHRFIHSARHVQINKKGQVKLVKGATQRAARHYAAKRSSLQGVTINRPNFITPSEDSTPQVGLPNEEEICQGENKNTSSPQLSSITVRELLTMNNEDAEIMNHIISHLENTKKTNGSFLDFFTLSTLHKEEIEKEKKILYHSDKIKEHLTEYLHLAVKNNHYHYLFNIFELTCLYKIEDVGLLRQLVEEILMHTTNEEQKVIHCYWIVKHLTRKKKHDQHIAVLLQKYLFNDSFFNFLQRNACINTSFVTLLSYVSDSIGYYPNGSVLPALHCTMRKYAVYFNGKLEKEIEPKMVNNVEELAKMQEIFVKNGFYDNDFNLLIKRLVLTSTSYVNPFDLLILSSNVLLNFVKNDHLLLHPGDQQGGATPLEGHVPPTEENFAKRYRNFLSTKNMIDVVIRTNDPYIANTCNDLAYIQRYLLLCSYCHFTLFSNWWADTVICDKLKKKRKPHKAVVRSRVPYKSHLTDQVSHLLAVLLQRYGGYGSEDGEVDPYVAADAVQSRPAANPPGDPICKYLPYLLKSFMRVAINKHEMIHNQSFIPFFEEIFLDIVDAFVEKYNESKRGSNVHSNTQGSHAHNASETVTRECAAHPGDYVKREESNNLLPSSNHGTLYTNEELSLYDLSSICECFFLVKLMQGGSVSARRKMRTRNGLSLLHASSNGMENQSNCPVDKSLEAFEKTLYIFLQRLPSSSELHLSGQHVHLMHKQDILEELVNKIRSCAEPIFLYYLMLRTILPILFSDTRQECLDVTKKIISCILSLPFRTSILVTTLSPAKESESTQKQLHHILKKLTQWENCVISTNSQRRIRVQTKQRGLPFDFVYAGEFLRPSSIFLLCLNEMLKWEEVYLPFVQEVFISDHASEGNKESFAEVVREVRDSLNFSVPRFLRERRT
ncbi:hypothetical protein AK88_00731 [Plasmodium fragile]|uniref:Uncharacterized protein n=1 Tax=Plasmodium fragile TaxID=5857 RepID=A0A0D9QQX7_PLAFR|nr:uncharacterized protein AK88_00731 [Plasmodium fragile]KJP89520.1 hypothetical protein AK88_00731 [Plasmodium fragile]